VGPGGVFASVTTVFGNAPVSRTARPGWLACHPPDGEKISRMLDEGFFLPAASKTAHHQHKEAARQLVRSYVKEYDDAATEEWRRPCGSR
jgi:hypothetical protein